MSTFTFTSAAGIGFLDDATVVQTLEVPELKGVVSGSEGIITDVSLTLNGLTHAQLDDLDILLVGPDGTTNLLLWSDAGGGNATELTVSLSDSGATAPDDGSLGSGTYAPADYGAPAETDADFGSATGGLNHAASTAGATFASAFDGIAPTGTWTLYVHDDTPGNGGSLASWSLTVSVLRGDDIILDGTSGDDTLLVTGEDSDVRTYSLNGQTPVAYSGISWLTFHGGDGNDSLISDGKPTGFHGFRFIAGDGNDYFFGDYGLDVADGGDGIDILYGDGGNDVLIGGSGADQLFGGSGYDTASYRTATGPVSASLIDGGGTLGDALGDTYSDMERLEGGDFDDLLVGDNTWHNMLFGRDGNDEIHGLGGWDSIRGEEGDDVLFGGDGRDSIEGGAGNDELHGGEGLDILDGGRGDDVIFFDALDTIRGAGGNDIAVVADPATSGPVTVDVHHAIVETVFASHFDDVLNAWGASGVTLAGLGGDDVLRGGSRADTAIYRGNIADYTVAGAAHNFTLTDTVAGRDGIDTLTDIDFITFADGTVAVEHLFGGDDVQFGTENADDLGGGDGNDTLVGLGGDDLLDGGAGDDTLDGGDGGDSLSGGDGNDSLDGGAGADTLDGGAGDDTLLAGNGNDTLVGGMGVNTLDGGDGVDTASYAFATAGVQVRLGGDAEATGGGGVTDTLRGIESLVGSAFDDVLIGSHSESITGGTGDDVLADANVLDGGWGSDTVSYTSGAMVDLAIDGPQRTDRVDQIFQTLVDIENIAGSEADDILKGNSEANQLMGSGGSDTLMGRAGDDTLDGGEGLDTASFGDSSTGVTVDLGIAGTQNTGEGFDTLIGIENLVGSEFADILKGDDGNNRLAGGAGDDLLMGRGGSDSLDGGEGIDTASFAEEETGVGVDLDHSGGSTLRSIENVVGSVFADTLVGSDGANALSGNAGDDVIKGGLGHDILTGGTGADRFLFHEVAESASGVTSRDVITDFQVGLDTIDLRVLRGLGSYVDFRLIGTRDFQGREEQLRYETFDQPGTANDITLVSGDVDGDRIADFEIEISGIVELTKNDFLL